MFVADISSIAVILVGGFVANIAVNFVKTLLASPKKEHKIIELQAERARDQAANAARTDITPEQKETYEVKIDRDFAGELERLDAQAAVISKRLSWVAAIGGLIGIAAIVANLGKLKQMILGSESSIEWLMGSAWAADTTKDAIKPDLTPLLPYVAMGVLLVMAITFVIAVITILKIKDTKENQASIKAADNIIKTFGGFFTGLATTLFH